MHRAFGISFIHLYTYTLAGISSFNGRFTAADPTIPVAATNTGGEQIVETRRGPRARFVNLLAV